MFCLSPSVQATAPVAPINKIEEKTETSAVKTKTLVKVIETNYKDHTSWLYQKRNSAESLLNYKLKQGLQQYRGPAMLITSGFRKTGWSRSLHRLGCAIDIKYDKKVIDYFLSSYGQIWLTSNNMEFFIEDTKNIQLPRSYKKHFRVVPWCTGKHVHLEYKKNGLRNRQSQDNIRQNELPDASLQDIYDEVEHRPDTLSILHLER